MNRDQLEQLLQHADVTAPPPPQAPGDLAATAERAVRRRRTVKAAGGIASSLLLLTAGMAWLRHDGPAGSAQRPAPPVALQPSPAAAANAQAELAALQAEVDRRLALVTRLQQIETQSRHRQAQRHAGPQGSSHRIDEQLDYAAFSMLYQADRMYNQYGLSAAAETTYRQVAEDFPGTKWADTARERLAQLHRKEG